MVAKRVFLEINAQPAGDCDEETFELVKMYISDGRKEVDVARELKAAGTDHAITIVVNAKRELGLLRGSSKQSCRRG